MKKLKKLQINHEKLMNNEELLKLNGGYNDCGCVCYNWGYEPIGAIGGDVTAITCNAECLLEFGSGFGHWAC